MAESWYFDLERARGNTWVWRRIGSDGGVIEQSRPFPYYLAAVRDAKAHGFSGEPEIARPPPPVQRKR